MGLNFFLNCIILILGSQMIFALAAAGEYSVCDEIKLLEGNISSVVVQDLTFGCNVVRKVWTKLSYQHTPGIGSHKVHTKALPWNLARKICLLEGGHLAVINSMAEAEVLVKLFNQAGPIIGTRSSHLAFLGIHDMFAEGDWVTVLDEDFYQTGYTEWSDRWGGQPDNGPFRAQNCGALVKDDKLDDFQCNENLAFICEIPEIANVLHYNETYYVRDPQ